MCLLKKKLKNYKKAVFNFIYLSYLKKYQTLKFTMIQLTQKSWIYLEQLFN